MRSSRAARSLLLLARHCVPCVYFGFIPRQIAQLISNPRFESTAATAPVPKNPRKKLKIPSSSEPPSPQPRPKKKATSQSAELLQYIESQPFIASSATNKLLLSKTKYLKVKRNVTESLCLINEEVAKTVIDLIQPHITDKYATVIEFNPGFGLLTSQLKSRLGCTNINCFEENEFLAKHLVQSIEGVNVIETNFLTLPRLHHLDKLDGGHRVYSALNDVKKDDSRPNEKLYVLGSAQAIDLINFTIKSLVTQKVLFDDDSYAWNSNNITYFLALGTRAYTILNATSELGFTVYRGSTILFQLLFNHVSLGLVSRRAFVPWETAANMSSVERSSTSSTRKKSKRRQTIPHDPESICVVKFSANQQNIEKIGKHNLFLFWYFVRHHLFARKHFVIPELEQWIPGCGPRLIRKGYTIYTQFGSLTPQQILEIYLEFSSWPEFQSSSFLNAAEKYQQKMDTQEDLADFSKSKY